MRFDATDIYDQLADTKFPYKLPYAYKHLGTGTRGSAFDIGGKKILKITNDESEAKASSLIAGKNVRGVWNVHGVYHSDNFGDIYFIVGEKLKEDEWRARDAVIVIDAFEVINTKHWDKATFDNIVKEITYPHEGSYYEVRKASEKAKKDALEIAHGMRNLNKLGIQFGDAHAGNIMFRGNKPVIIDLGYSKSGEGDIKQFEQIGPYKVGEYGR